MPFIFWWDPARGKKAPFYVFGHDLVAITYVRPKKLALVFDQSLARGKEYQQLHDRVSRFAAMGFRGLSFCNVGDSGSMKAKPVLFRGASGRIYHFHVYSLELTLKNVGAVYALTRRTIENNGKDSFRIIYIGQTDELGKTIGKHRRELWTMEHEFNSVCVHLEKDVIKRIQKMDDLSKYYSPKIVSSPAK